MSTENKITVLGLTFNSEEERRSYFREELRKKLPELKLMEGFPIGDDEDILNLSDPPYYTACPNPWLNDFIAEWEEEKKELVKQGLRKADFEVTEPYAADVSEGKNNPVYKAHSYITKVPHPAIMRYLLHYTETGDIVYDGFSGTGMTGVAAQLCEFPNSTFKMNFEKDIKSPISWGGRKFIGNDLSVLGSFIANHFNHAVFNLDQFSGEIKAIEKKIKTEYGWMYKTIHSDNKTICDIDYIIWSDKFVCNNCGHDIIYWDSAVNEERSTVEDNLVCNKCNLTFPKSKLSKSFKSVFNNGKAHKIIDALPVLIKYEFRGKTYLKRPDDYDFELLAKIENTPNPNYYPTSRMIEGGESRRNDRNGLTNSNDFFTKRSELILSLLYRELSPENRILFTSLLNRSTKLNCTVMSNYFKQLHGKTVGGWAGKPREGTLYLPSISSEVNIMHSIKSRLSSISKLKLYINKFNPNNSIISTTSSTSISLSDNSIDYIFTDPPFGANRAYSELNFLIEDWLRVLTNNSQEAIENKSVNKSIITYLDLMQSCFMDFYRVLKPGRWMTVEFSNTNASVWNGIHTSIQKAGFIIANISGLDKKQGSIQAVTTPTAVKQDLIISCYKPSSEFDQKFSQHKHSDVGIWEFVAEHLEHLPIHLVSGNSTTAIIERSPKILFDRLIAFYVQRGLPVPIDAGKFQQGLRERFIERDGMFFTNEQVQEYDSKKAAVPNFVQLSIFVSNEQDAIYWLRHILEAAPKTEQDLHPLWMKEVAGNMRKGDTLPEMRTILEENFLKNDKGQWYLPDPENEADLEKLRTKRLIKQFEAYKTEASKPKGKIKEARVEALRAGFKHCYQEKDFKTIVQIGDRIPNNLLMEDEVLLQFYDIASSRV
ncbi:MAG: DNA methylase [Clostridia bacterium]|nr:DNA methylase [Clostridia bacterium]